MKNKSSPSVAGRGRGEEDAPVGQQQQHSNSNSGEIVKNEQGEGSSSSRKSEPSSSSQQKQIPSVPENSQQQQQDEDDSSGEFETVVGRRHAHSNSMKFRDNNNVVSGRGKYNNTNYRRYRRPPFHENRNNNNNNVDKSTAPKVETNGSICSETSSNSSTDGHLASTEENGHISASNGTESAGENDACDNSEESKVKYVDAPPPAVNPWQVNSKASSVIAKPKPPSVKNERTPLSVLVAAPQTFADSVSHKEPGHAAKARPYSLAKPIERISVEEDWPALDEVVQQSTLPKSALDIRLVRFATESTDSGGEETLQSPQNNNPLSQEKWPSIADAAVQSKKSHDENNEGESTPTVICIEIDSTNEVMAGASSRDGDVSGEEPTNDDSKKKKTRGASRPKWIPLNLPETGTNKSKSPRRDRPVDKSSSKPYRATENSDTNNGNGRAVGRGGGRGRGGGSSNVGQRGGRGGGVRNGARYNHQSFHKESYDHNNSATRHVDHRDDYTDYPLDFTTISPIYPMSGFIMPYVTNFVPPFATSPLDSDPGLPYTVGQDMILTDLVQKQIEYYFSEENLDKDFYLRRKMDVNGYLPVRLISSFHRVKNMTQDYGLVLTAIRLSSKLELSENHNFVRTITEPTKWPILDSAMALPPLHPTLMMPVSSGILIPLPPNGVMNNNNDSSSK